MEDSSKHLLKLYADEDGHNLDNTLQIIVKQVKSMFGGEVIDVLKRTFWELIFANDQSGANQDLILKYHQHYLKNYWSVYKSIAFVNMFISWVLLVISPIKLSKSNTFALFYLPFLMTGVTILDFLVKKNTNLLSTICVGMTMYIGCDFILLTMIEDEFSI